LILEDYALLDKMKTKATKVDHPYDRSHLESGRVGAIRTRRQLRLVLKEVKNSYRGIPVDNILSFRYLIDRGLPTRKSVYLPNITRRFNGITVGMGVIV